MNDAFASPKGRPIGARSSKWIRFIRHRALLAGVVIVTLAVVTAIFSPVVTPYDPTAQNYVSVLSPPSFEHLLGTDQYGRDILSRIVFGTRVSILIGVGSVLIAALTGASIGLASGYGPSWLDEVLMRTMDAIYAFPSILLALSIAATLGPGLGNVLLAISIVYVPIFARLVRGQTLTLREREFVVAAVAAGLPKVSIAMKHILPNAFAPILVQISLSTSFAIITEAALSFLGIGVRPPTASWGEMLRTGYAYLGLAPWLSVFPGAAIFATVLGLNLLGDGLRDALDPKFARRLDIRG